MTDPIFLQTVGLEIEVTDVNTNNIYLPSSWHVTQDASVESDILTLNGIPLINNTDIQRLNLSSQLQGGELISSIIDTHSNYIQDLKTLCNTLIAKGEPDRSERAGLHVHLSFTNPSLAILKNIIKLGCHLEDVFFLIGGMGYDFRGLTNDCSYCRPITAPGPQVIEDDSGRLFPCFVIDDLLEAKTIQDFKIRLGDYYHLGESKYIPIRYHWLNLWNIWNNRETLEFRIFNHSLKPRYIEVAIEISKAFGNAVMYYNYHPEELEELECNSVYDHRDKAEILETFLNFATPHLESRIVDLALRIMDTTPISSIRLSKIPFYFHLRFHRNGNRSPVHWIGSSYRPSVRYKRDQVAEPYFEDVHNLRAQRRAQNPEPEVDYVEELLMEEQPSWFDGLETQDGEPSLEMEDSSPSLRQPIEVNELGNQVVRGNWTAGNTSLNTDSFQAHINSIVERMETRVDQIDEDDEDEEDN